MGEAGILSCLSTFSIRLINLKNVLKLRIRARIRCIKKSAPAPLVP